MRLLLRHELEFSYDPPARSMVKILRLTPRGHDGQHVIGWRIEADADFRLKQAEDAFGNITHTLTVNGPLDMLPVRAIGEVELFDQTGLVRGAAERFPPELFLRTTILTQTDETMRAFAADVAGGQHESLAILHGLMDQLVKAMPFDQEAVTPPRGMANSAVKAFESRKGTSQNIAHVFIALARYLGIPSRFVSGYCLMEGSDELRAGHGWAECHVPGLGWVAFDAALGHCPRDRHVRLACGLDAEGSASVRGAQAIGLKETCSAKDDGAANRQQSHFLQAGQGQAQQGSKS